MFQLYLFGHNVAFSRDFSQCTLFLEIVNKFIFLLHNINSNTLTISFDKAQIETQEGLCQKELEDFKKMGTARLIRSLKNQCLA